MKMNFKKLIAAGLACVSLVSMMSLNVFAATDASADDEFTTFLAIGADTGDSTAWNTQYYGDGNTGNTSNYTTEMKTIGYGDTVKVEFTANDPMTLIYFATPVIATEGKTFYDDVTFSVKAYVDGAEVTIDKSVDSEGEIFWGEDTGDFKKDGDLTGAFRVYGGWNTYADNRKYIADPSGAKTIAFEITMTSAKAEAAVGTGDSTNVGVFAVVAVAALGVCAVAGKKRVTE